MGTRTRCIRSQSRGLCVCVALLVAALFFTASAEGQNNIALVCFGPSCDLPLGIPLSQRFDAQASAAAFDDAIELANTSAIVDTIQVIGNFDPLVPGATTFALGAVNTPVMEDLTIQGLGAPQDLIIERLDPAMPVLEIINAAVRIEGVTLSGGSESIHAMAAMASTVEVLRCLLTGFSDAGILVEGMMGAHVESTCVEGGPIGVDLAGTATSLVLASTFIGCATGIDVGPTATLELFNTIIDLHSNFGVDVQVGGMIGGDDTNNIRPLAANTNPPGALLGTVTDDDPVFDPVDWPGQLNAASPMIDPPAGTDITGSLLLDIDFDSNPRVLPIGSMLYDIGADEFDDGSGGAGAWTGCIVEPFIGQRGVGGMTVLITISSFGGGFLNPGDADYLNGTKVVIVPETSRLGLPALTAFDFQVLAPEQFVIPLNMTQLSDNLWLGTNAIAITSDPLPGPAANTPAYTPLFVDGEAYVTIINDPPGMISPMLNPPLPGSQAVTGRMFVLDTHPPRLDVGMTGRDGSNFVFGSNDLVTLLDQFNQGNALAPQLGGAPGAWPDAAFVTVSNDLISNTQGSSGAKVFFNHAADFDPSFAVDPKLDFTVTATFVDEPPAEWLVLPNLLLPTFKIGGFDPNLTVLSPVTLTVAELTGTDPTSLFMPRWIMSNGRSKLIDSEAVGVDPLVIQATFTDATIGDYPRIQVDWVLTSNDYDEANNPADPFHLEFQFAPMDFAGNLAPEDELLDPLHIWWFLRTRAQLSPYMNTEVDTPNFTWELKRGADPGQVDVSDPVRPAFAFRFLRSVTADRNGPYAPLRRTPAAGFSGIDINGWSPGYTYDTGLNFNWFENNGFTTSPLTTDTWLILMVVGLDEAGDVQQLPYDNANFGLFGIDNMQRILPGAPELYTLSAAGGVSWQRFLIRGPGSQQETGNLNGSINATFWHERVQPGNPNSQIDGDEALFENARIVPLPSVDQFSLSRNIFTHFVRGFFNIDYEASNPAGNEEFGIVWVLQRDGQNVSQGIIPDGNSGFPPSLSRGTATLILPPYADDRQPLAVPLDTPPLGPWLGDENRRRAVNYVLKVATIRTSSGQWPPQNLQPPNNGFITFEQGGADFVIDETPVNYPFTVVPDVAGYIENKASPDNQPVKVLESN